MYQSAAVCEAEVVVLSAAVDVKAHRPNSWSQPKIGGRSCQPKPPSGRSAPFRQLSVLFIHDPMRMAVVCILSLELSS